MVENYRPPGQKIDLPCISPDRGGFKTIQIFFGAHMMGGGGRWQKKLKSKKTYSINLSETEFMGNIS